MNDVARFVYHRVERRLLGLVACKVSPGWFDVVVLHGSRYVAVKQAILRDYAMDGRGVGQIYVTKF